MQSDRAGMWNVRYKSKSRDVCTFSIIPWWKIGVGKRLNPKITNVSIFKERFRSIL